VKQFRFVPVSPGKPKMTSPLYASDIATRISAPFLNLPNHACNRLWRTDQAGCSSDMSALSAYHA
jgi:hypothetical protein